MRFHKRGRLRKRKIKHAKRAWRQQPTRSSATARPHDQPPVQIRVRTHIQPVWGHCERGGGVLKSMLTSDIAIIDIKEHQIEYFKVIIKLF